MATIGEVNVTVNLDVATGALRAIREHASKTFVDECSVTAYGDALCDIVKMTQGALDQCQAEQSENARLRAALRELIVSMRTSGRWKRSCDGWAGEGSTYLEVRITAEALDELERLANPEAGVRPDAVREG